METVPYGYAVAADGSIEVVPEEAAVVQLVFKLAAQGMSERRIAKIINRKLADGTMPPYVPLVQ